MTHPRFYLLAALLVLAMCVPFRAIAESDVDVFCTKLAATPGDTNLLSQLKAQVSKTSDVDEKARLAAIYCLGCMYTRQTKEAESVQTYLQKNFPSDPNITWLTDGSLRDACKNCGGVGKADLPCALCSGTGQCKTCQGQGSRNIPTFNGSEYRKCTVCNGTGKCKDCGGTGKTRALCPLCSGTGGAFSPAKLKAKYLATLKGTGIHSQPLASASTSSQTPGIVDTSGMDEVFRKQLESYANAFKENKLDVLIHNALLDIEVRDTTRRGCAKYEQQARKMIAQAEAEKVRQKEAMEAKARLEQREHQANSGSPAARATENDSSQSLNTLTRAALKLDDDKMAAWEREYKERQVEIDRIYNAHKDDAGEGVDFKEVLISPEKYKNKVLVTRIPLAPGSRGTVSYYIDAIENKGGQLSCPEHLCRKTDRISTVRGKFERSVIKFWCSGDVGSGYDTRSWVLLDVK